VAAASGEVGQQSRAVGERHDVGDDVLAHRVPLGTQQVDRLRGQPLAVPGVVRAAGHPTDLCAPDNESVVVELRAEAQRRAVVAVEGEVHHGALGSQQP
jgi:hypothetical protein